MRNEYKIYVDQLVTELNFLTESGKLLPGEYDPKSQKLQINIDGITYSRQDLIKYRLLFLNGKLKTDIYSHIITKVFNGRRYR